MPFSPNKKLSGSNLAPSGTILTLLTHDSNTQAQGWEIGDYAKVDRHKVNGNDPSKYVYVTRLRDGYGNCYIPGSWKVFKGKIPKFEKWLRCSRCDDSMPEKKSKTIKGKLYCARCAEHFVKCDKCGELHEKSGQRKYSKKYYCKKCFSVLFIKCGRCGDPALKTEAMTDAERGESFCQGCWDHLWTKCDDCGEKIRRDHAHGYNDEHHFCDECFHEKYFRCPRCERILPQEEGRTIETRDHMYCQKCYDQIPKFIHDYSYKPKPIFFKTRKDRKDSLYLGVEVEACNTDHNANNDNCAGELLESMNSNKKLIYMKYDGSVDYGFEIVSHPFTYNWLQANKKAFMPVFGLRSKGFHSHTANCCGMHVHMSKRAFTSLHLYKFLKFFYEMDQRFVLKVSQRKHERYEEWSKSKLSNGEKTVSAAKKKLTNERHTAVNLQNPKTAEIRIFRGTLRPDRFMKNIEFCLSAYDFTRDAGCRDITLEKYKTFLGNHKKNYKNLMSFLTEKGEI